MNDGNVHEWCHSFNGGRIDVHNGEQSGRLSVIAEDLKDRDDIHARENRRFVINELREVSHVS
jgi:hypothetical protein